MGSEIEHAPEFRCPDRPKLGWFRRQAAVLNARPTHGHEPLPGSERMRMVTWREFGSVLCPVRAATCRWCDGPIVNPVGNVWGLREENLSA